MKKNSLVILLVVLVVGTMIGAKKYLDFYVENSVAEETIAVGGKKTGDNKEEKEDTEDSVKEELKDEDKEEKSSEEQSEYNDVANFTLTDLQGNEVSLSDYKGKKVFINFWATWCGYCVKEMPDIQKLYDEVNEEEIVILTVNVGEDKETAEKFIKENKYEFTVLLDEKVEVASKYGIASYPTSVLIDKNGDPIVIARGMLTYDQMQKFIKSEKKDFQE